MIRWLGSVACLSRYVDFVAVHEAVESENTARDLPSQGYFDREKKSNGDSVEVLSVVIQHYDTCRDLVLLQQIFISST